MPEKNSTTTKENSQDSAKTDLLSDLNSEQKQAVTHGDGPLLIVAGAGTGKTTVITRRIAWLVLEKGLKPEEILALTFTDKAAGEMEERVDRLLPYGYVDLWVSTFHSFAERILKAHALDIGLPADVKLLDTTQTWMLVRKNLDRFNLDYYKPLGNPTKFIHALLAHFSRLKDELVCPQNYLDYVENLKLNTDSDIVIDGNTISGEVRADEIARLEELANAYHVYEHLLIENNALDFGSLLTRVIELFKKRPPILKQYQNQFKYLLVDEFQDTNIAQYELVKLLAAPKNNLTVVGDDDQAVYKFRGASLSNILEFKKDFPEAKEIFLKENYRSKQTILDLAHDFIQQNNPNRLEFQLGRAGLSKKLLAQKGAEGVIAHLHAETAHGEARMVLETILELKKKDSEATWNDFAVLVRANDHAGIFIRLFDEADIPYELVTARGLYSKPVILDLVAYARLLDDPYDNPSAYRVLTSPISALKEQVVSKLLYWSSRKSWSVLETLRRAGTLEFDAATVAECGRLVSLIEKHASLARRTAVSKVFFTILEETGYLKNLSIDDEINHESLRHLNQFYRKLSDFEAAHAEPFLKNFLADLHLEIESGEQGRINLDPNEGPESVKIMTCHAAKGLEFKYVFITHLVDRRFPTIERKELIEIPDALVKEQLLEGDIHLEEERRLFYVACTRAREGLFFTSADDYGGARKKKLSRFLLELQALNKLGETVAGISEKTPARTANHEKAKKETVVSLPRYFSYTKLKAFETCPLQYKFSHILKIPVRGRPTFSFGKTIHATLQKFCEQLKMRHDTAQVSLFEKSDKKSANEETHFPSLKDLLDIYEQEWVDDWFEDGEQKKQYYEKGKKLLKLFYEQAQKDPPHPKYLEKVFHLKINGYTIKGVIDRVDEKPDGTLEVIDYKTGAAREMSEVDKDQLYIYQLALQEILGGKPSALTYYYVENGNKISFLGTSENLEKLKKKILDRIQEMRISTFPATPAKEKCKHCDFKNICEFRIL